MQTVLALPIPTLLCVAGLLLVFSAFGLEMKDWKFRVTKGQVWLKGIVGILLLISGIILQPGIQLIRPMNMEKMEFGRNLGGKTIGEGFKAHEPLECELKCSTNEKCDGWTFRLPGSGNLTSCTLYSDSRSVEPNDTIVSGKKQWIR